MIKDSVSSWVSPGAIPVRVAAVPVSGHNKRSPWTSDINKILFEVLERVRCSGGTRKIDYGEKEIGIWRENFYGKGFNDFCFH